MAARTGDSRWITGEEARKHAHRMRDRADAVLVGVGTVLADDPELTVRHVQGQDPVRVVLDSALRTPLTSKLLRSGRSPVWIFHTEDADTERALRLRDAGAVLFATPRGSRGLDLDSVLRELSRRDVMKLLVEGGPHVHGALLDGGFVDRVSLFFAPRILGDAEGMPLAFGLARTRISEAFHVVRPELRKLGEDLLIEGRLERPKEA
jgi:diaminohydroxyphosphoribosylaminopyrimidine deaminase/5-amino-6-(5-phosphoribosylamino)uracil reductase